MWNPSQHSLAHGGNTIVGFIPWRMSPLECVTSSPASLHFTFIATLHPVGLHTSAHSMGPYFGTFAKHEKWIAKDPVPRLPLSHCFSKMYNIIRPDSTSKCKFLSWECSISEYMWLKHKSINVWANMAFLKSFTRNWDSWEGGRDLTWNLPLMLTWSSRSAWCTFSKDPLLQGFLSWKFCPSTTNIWLYSQVDALIFATSLPLTRHFRLWAK